MSEPIDGHGASQDGACAPPVGAACRESDPAQPSRIKILDTGERLFALHGFAGVGLREVADDVGLGKSSLFHHYPSKARLYAAVVERVMRDFDSRLAACDVRGRSAIERLHAWVDTAIDALTEHPSWAPLLLRRMVEVDVLDLELESQLEAINDGIIQRISAALRDGIAAGELREISIPHTIHTLIAMTVFYFAASDFSEGLLREPITDEEPVRARRKHIHDYVETALRAKARAGDASLG